MRHRDATAAATGVLPGLDPAYLAAKERLAAGKSGVLTPLNDSERRIVEATTQQSDPIFPLHE